LRLQISLLAVALTALACGACTQPSPGPSQPAGASLLVVADASLEKALQEVCTRYANQEHVLVRTRFANSKDASDALLGGASADAFIANDVDWVRRLGASGRLVPGSRRVVLAAKVTATGNPSSSARYHAAVLRASAQPELAKKFLDFLASEDAQSVFVRHGFARASEAPRGAAHRQRPEAGLAPIR
jgi:ABC-type molybdate transport system substrate-binding protein